MTLEPLTEELTRDQLVTALAASRTLNELLEEDIADLERADEAAGWRTLELGLDRTLSREGMRNVVRNCTLMSIASPMIKRGVLVRIGYVWAQGVEISARADGGAEQDVNQVVQDFLDDPMNQLALTGQQAQEDNERTLETEGQVFVACFPDPLTGKVQVRVVPFDEIQDRVSNPQDRADVWFFLRQYTAVIREAGYAGVVRQRRETRRVLHPALGYWPKTRPKVIDGIPVAWDEPILHVAVNRPKHAKWGIPDVYAALPWARAYEGFLTDWRNLMKALARFAWKLTADKGVKAKRAAATLASVIPGDPTPASQVGAAVVNGPGIDIEAIPKTGATIDADSGRPLASLVGAALGLPVTTLLADPGVTGARAVAETLDLPTTLEMNARRRLWTSVFQTLLGYAIDQAVAAPRGPLRGTVVRDDRTDRVQTVLAGDVEKTITVEWPDLDDLDPVKLVEAIVKADSTQKMPPLETLRLLLQALQVKDADEIIESVTDADGNFIDPLAGAGQALVSAFNTIRVKAGQGDPAVPADPDTA